MATFKIGFDLNIAGKQRFYESVLQEGKSYRVGRQGEWLCIPDPALSRYHFELRVQRESVRVVDLTSTNGLFLNALKLKEAPVKPGDVLTFGECSITVKTLSVVLAGGPQSSAPAISEVVLPGAVGSSLTERAQQDNLIPTLSPLRAPQPFFNLAYKKPHQLFREADYHQSSRDSLLLIVGVAWLQWFLGSIPHMHGNVVRIISQAFIFAAGVLVLAGVFALMMKTFREFLQIESSIRQYLALFSYAYVIFFPVLLLCAFFPGAMLLSWLGFTGFALFAATESTVAPAKKVIPAFLTSWAIAVIPAVILISLVL